MLTAIIQIPTDENDTRGAAIPARRPASSRKAHLAAPDADAAQQWLKALGTQPGEAVATDLIAQGAAAAGAVRAFGALDGEKASAAVDVLVRLDRAGVNKDLRSAARSSLHKLEGAGFGLTQEGEAPAPARPNARVATLYRVIASAFDGNGSRSVWFGAERPLGGVYSIGTVMNDTRGLLDVSGRDTTRKHFTEQERTVRQHDPSAWVELPVEYGLQLLNEALELAREAGRVAPGYAVWSETLGEPVPFTEALVYRDVPAFEMKMHPTLQNESAELFQHAEVEAWFFEPAKVAKWARQLAEPASQRLVVTPETEQGRLDRITREALGELLTPKDLHGLKRRLEETAYIFLQTDRELDARRAIAAAVTIEEPRPLRAPHPFLKALWDRSIDIAQRVQRTGFEPVRLEQAE